MPNIISNLYHLFCCRQTGHLHLPTLAANNTLAPMADTNPFLLPLHYLAVALAVTSQNQIPPALRAEIRESLLAMGAEADFLRREIESDFWRVYLQTGWQRGEGDLGRQWEECWRRWAASLQGLEGACRPFWDPVEAEFTVMMVEGGLE